MIKIFPDLIKMIKPHYFRNSVNPKQSKYFKRHRQMHIIIKFQKTSDKYKIVKPARNVI